MLQNATDRNFCDKFKIQMRIIRKRESCLYCGEKMESKTAKRKFCSDQHRVYFSRLTKEEKAERLGMQELAAIKKQSEKSQEEINAYNAKIGLEIDKIKAEVNDKTTDIGRRVFRADQEKRINELKSKLIYPEIN